MAYAAPSSVYIAAGDGLGDEIYANEDVRAAAAAFRAEVKRVWDRDVVEGGERAEFRFLVDVCIAVAKVVTKADAKGQANAEAKGQADAEAKGQADAKAKATTTSSEMVRHLRAVNVSYQKFVDAQKSEQKNEQHGRGGVAATCCEGGADGGLDGGVTNNDDHSVPHKHDGHNDGHTSDGLVHTMKQTATTDEYSRGDMECPNCERMGPTRYTGHKYCVRCGFCTFCSLVNPTCKPLTEEEELNAWDDEDFIPDEDLTPTQLAARKAKEEEVLKRQAQAEYCAQHMTDGKNALHDFYEWQRRMM
jgi:hypothetical protein